MRSDDDALLREHRRLSLRISVHLADPPGLRDPAIHLALIDELEALRERLLAARDQAAQGLHHTRAAFVATQAYGRSHRLRG